MNLEKLADGIVAHTTGYIKRCLTPIIERLKTLEAWKDEPEEMKALIERHAVNVWPGLVDQQIESKMESIAVKTSLLVPAGRDGLPGRPGTPGEDGFTIDDFELAMKDERNLEITMRCGDRVVTKSVKLAALPVYRGIYEAGKIYQANDLVTYGGSIWRAHRSSGFPPKGKNDNWNLVVKGAK